MTRLVGIELALDLIATGRTLTIAQAREAGLIDVVAEGEVTQAAIAHARHLAGRAEPLRRISEQNVDADSLPSDFFANARDTARREKTAYPAALAIIDTVEASLLPFREGEQVEAKAFAALLRSPQSRALRHLFFAPRQATKGPGLSIARDKAREIGAVGVLGGGTMGRGIAMNFLNAGLSVTIVETTEAARDAARRGILETYQAAVARKRIDGDELQRRMVQLQVTTDDAALAGSDLVIEAVFEDLALKLQVCERLGRLCKPGAIIATNTSTLDVDALAQATGRPADVVGMHFFSPAHIMKLLEVVRGRDTAPEVLLTVVGLAQKIGKVPVVSGVCWGFIGNRMLEVYLRETEFLLMEGATPGEIDTAIEAVGFAMGPCRMLDLAGIDVGAKVVIEQAKAGRLPDDPSYRVVVRRLFELGRHGQKAGRGYYRYEGRQAIPDAQVEAIARELGAEHGVARRSGIAPGEIVERLLFPLINEGARILEEGIAYRASDIDVVWTSGYGFPDFLGGPMFHADQLGLRHVADRLDCYARSRGNRHGYWTPATLLNQLAATGGQFNPS
jgi:3-hydroxyacyl-CoA dehydrogenase